MKMEIIEFASYKIMHIIHEKNKAVNYSTDDPVLILDVNNMLEIHEKIEKFLIKIGAIDKKIIKIA